MVRSLDSHHVATEHWHTVAPKLCLSADANEVWRHFRDLQTNQIVLPDLFGVLSTAVLPAESELQQQNRPHDAAAVRDLRQMLIRQGGSVDRALARQGLGTAAELPAIRTAEI